MDGKPRLDGVSLPQGKPDDPLERETVHGLGGRKDAFFRETLAADGMKVYRTTVTFIEQLQARGLKTALVSSSKNTGLVLGATGLADLFALVVDGLVAERLGLPGKPAPDTFLEAARRLDVPPGRGAVVEDAVAGVEARVAGGFALVISVARKGDEEALRGAGAGIVVGDLAELVPV